MRLIINIPQCYYEHCKSNENPIAIEVSVANGVPIDRLKYEIMEVAEKESKYDVTWAMGLSYATQIIDRALLEGVDLDGSDE